MLGKMFSLEYMRELFASGLEGDFWGVCWIVLLVLVLVFVIDISIELLIRKKYDSLNIDNSKQGDKND